MSILSQALQSELDTAPILTAEFELGGQTFKVGCRPMTAADFTMVNKGLPVSLQNDPTQFDGQIEMIIRKARMLDDDGGLTTEKAFTVADKANLRRVRVDLIAEMFSALFGEQISADEEDDKIEEAKGN